MYGRSDEEYEQIQTRKAMTDNMTPRQIVAELDRYIVGQGAAKRAVAVAIRNRWRRQQLPADLRQDVTPKNIIMIGPTGVGKTEIARRLAQLVGAPFVKVEATKYTEVGYVGRDVESMIRDLTEIAVGLVKQKQRDQVVEKAKARVSDKLLDLIVPNTGWMPPEDTEETERRQRTRDKFKALLDAGELEDKQVELPAEQKPALPFQMLTATSMENLQADLQSMFDSFGGKQTGPRTVTVREARQILLEQETEALIDRAAVQEQAVNLVENQG